MGLLLSRSDWRKYLDCIESYDVPDREHAAGTSALLVLKTVSVRLLVKEV